MGGISSKSQRAAGAPQDQGSPLALPSRPRSAILGGLLSGRARFRFTVRRDCRCRLGHCQPALAAEWDLTSTLRPRRRPKKTQEQAS